MIDRESVIEAAAALASVLVMLGVMLYVGMTYGSATALGDQGAEVMVGAIVAFILFVTVLGVGLAYATSDPTPPDDDATA
ncbi:DUF7472 family protein [Halovivax cerinus]|uniref:Transporter n=1 Tax=Halovivax cerinus TaxID=1487865 RepID=A0ABD5NQM5_9EURY|nr:hypothetical protein [Halovivax cerinus]